jgi:DNA-binding LacI/PurR family transcriptional regulator
MTMPPRSTRLRRATEEELDSPHFQAILIYVINRPSNSSPQTGTTPDVNVNVNVNGGGYRDVRDIIRQRIQSGVWPAGHRLPTLIEAGRLFRVNVNTVQRAISELQKEGFVESRGRHGSFASDRWVTQAGAGSQARGDGRTLAGVRAGILSYWRPESPGHAPPGLVILDRLLTSRFCQEGGTLEHFCHERAADPTVQEMDELIGASSIQALLLPSVASLCCPALRQVIRRRGISLIGFSGTVGEEVDVDVVRIDDAWAFRRAAEYLTELGHRRIAFIGLPSKFGEWIRVRQTGFGDALRERGLQFSSDTVFGLGELEIPAKLPESLRPPEPLRPDQPGHAYAIGCRFPAGRFSAAVCCNDHVAIAFIAALRERGIRVPEDVSVIGYDNMPMEIIQKELTTFTLPDQRIADAVASLILRRVTGDHGMGDQVIALLRPILVERKTCQEWRDVT